MAQTLKFGNGTWATKKGSTLAYNDENDRFKPLPFTTTRASSATRVNKEGLIEVVENDRPRIDYTDSEDGVFLLEKASTNLVTYSEDFSQSTWVKVNTSVTSNSTISPDGTLNSDKLIPSNTVASIFMYNQVTLNASDYTLSFFVKYDGRQYVQLLFGSNVSLDYSNFDLVNQTVTYGNGNIEYYGNDWYRISLTSNVNSGTTEVYLWSIDSALSSRASSSTGNGVNGYYIYGAMLEQGNLSSYIPTQGSTVTRVADTASGAGNSEVFNDSEGVLMFEGSFSSTDLGTSVVAISDGSTSNRIILGYIGTSNDLYCQSIGGASAPSSMSFSVTDITLNNKIIIKYKANDFSFWVNGFVVGARTSGTTPSNLNNLSLDSGTGSSNLYGKTKEIAYYDEILTDLELETLTSYRSLNELVTELNLKAL